MGETLTKDFGSFKINDQGRPEGTVETDKGVVHYTCNPPSNEVLEKAGILAIGNVFNTQNGSSLSNNELLLIPKSVFEKEGREVNTIEAENILRDIGKEDK